MKRELNKNRSVDEVYYTACSLLVILKNSFNKLHSQKGLNLIRASRSVVPDGGGGGQRQHTPFSRGVGVQTLPSLRTIARVSAPALLPRNEIRHALDLLVPVCSLTKRLQ